MQLDLDHDADEPWHHVVAEAAPCDHIVQLYQDEDFLSRAVCRFAGAALSNGEGIILVPTLPHWNAIRPRLEAEGVDVEEAQTRGQLTVVDSDDFLPRFMKGAMPRFDRFSRPCGRRYRKSAGKWPLPEGPLVG